MTSFPPQPNSPFPSNWLYTKPSQTSSTVRNGLWSSVAYITLHLLSADQDSCVCLLVETVSDNVVRFTDRWPVNLKCSSVVQLLDSFAFACFINFNLLGINLVCATEPCLCYPQYLKLRRAVFVEKSDRYSHDPEIITRYCVCVRYFYGIVVVVLPVA